MERCRRLVLVTYPLQGHINPMLDLASILHSKGFSITIAHINLNPPEPANNPDFTFLPISDGLSADWDGSSSSLIDLASTINRNCEAPFKRCLSRMIEQQEQQQHGQVVCVIYDFVMHFAEKVANELGLRSIIFRTSNAATLLGFCTVAKLKARGQDFSSQDYSISDDLVPGLHPFRFKDLPIFSMGSFDKISQLFAVLCNSRTSSAIIFNTIDRLENSALTHLQGQFHIPFFHIGPMHKIAPPKPTCLLKDENNCMRWLDKQAPNSVLYVSIGSIATMNEKELTEMAWGLADSNQPFLWVLRPDSGYESSELLPDGFREFAGERACIVKWAPQKNVLAHHAVGAFLSHCGWNSTLESLSEGVPMICKPYFGDQTMNARYLSHEWGMGIELGNFRGRAEIAEAVRRILVEKEGEEMRQKAISLREQIQNCLKGGGSTSKSLDQLVELLSSF